MQGSDNMRILGRFLWVLGVLCVADVHAVDLRGMASVSITSDTSANAKNIAFDEARRQIINDSLRQYVDVDALNTVLRNAKSADLMNLVSSSSIEGEKVSDTTYSANISMVLDSGVVRTWMQDNGIQNWLPDDSRPDVFLVTVTLANPIADWIQLNQIARNEKIELGTRVIAGGVVTLELPVSVRGRFTIAVREAGWRFANNDGVLRIWK